MIFKENQEKCCEYTISSSTGFEIVKCRLSNNG